MKTFELLKELLLLEKAGATDSVHNAINLAIQIHCESNGLDQVIFIDKLKLIHDIAWRGFNFGDITAHKIQLEIYEQLINDTLA